MQQPASHALLEYSSTGNGHVRMRRVMAVMVYMVLASRWVALVGSHLWENPGISIIGMGGRKMGGYIKCSIAPAEP